MEDYPHIKRKRQENTKDGKEMLDKSGLMAALLERPAYLQNDYLDSIKRALQPEFPGAKAAANTDWAGIRQGLFGNEPQTFAKFGFPALITVNHLKEEWGRMAHQSRRSWKGAVNNLAGWSPRCLSEIIC